MGKGSRQRLATQPAAVCLPEVPTHSQYGRLESTITQSRSATQLWAKADYESGSVRGGVFALPGGQIWCTVEGGLFEKVVCLRPGTQVLCTQHTGACAHDDFVNALYYDAPEFFEDRVPLRLVEGSGRRSYLLPNGDVAYLALGLPSGTLICIARRGNTLFGAASPTSLPSGDGWVDFSNVVPDCRSCDVINRLCPHTELADPPLLHDSEALLLPDAVGLNAVFQRDSIVLQNKAWPEFYLRLSSDGSYSLRSHQPDAQLAYGHCGPGTNGSGTQAPFGARLYQAYVTDLKMASPEDYVHRLGLRLLVAARAQRAAGTR